MRSDEHSVQPAAGSYNPIDDLASLSAIDVRRPSRVADLKRPLSIVMVGGMCAGKSTLAHALASAELIADRCTVARRCSTREPRAMDAADGVSAVSWMEFQRLRASHAFALSWERPLIDGSTIGYGCYPIAGNGVPILMAGHGVYSNRQSVRPVDALDRALLVGVSAPPDIRAERLVHRSPDVISLGRARTLALLAHDDTAMEQNVDLVIHNYGENEPVAVDQLIAAIALIIDRAGY